MNENLAIAHNVSTSQETLARLASITTDDYYRLRGEDQISNSTWEIIDRHGKILVAIAENPNTPLDALKTIHQGILCGVAENPNTSSQILEKLASLEDSYLRAAIARNPNCPLPILEKLELSRHLDKKVQDG
jgi:hypothetical protein